MLKKIYKLGELAMLKKIQRTRDERASLNRSILGMHSFL